MAEDQKANNTKIIVAVVVLVIAAVGGYLYYQEQNANTISLSVGGETFSATVK